MPEKILAAMSGGVDSAATAALLLEQGHEVIGARMIVWGDTPDDGSALPPIPDVEDAKAVAGQLSIAFHVFDFRAEFEENVVRPFVCDYLQGRTPNPCVRCNPTMKLGLLLDKATELGCDAIATGHYVKIEQHPNGRWGIRRGDEPNREQSYYLHRLTQEQLARFRAPLGTWAKEDVRRYAAKRGLKVADKPGSQEICFVPGDDYRSFVRSHPLAAASRNEPGEIVNRAGEVVGRHTGIMDYTIGQRRGLGIAHTEPLYVLEIDPSTNRVLVGEKSDVFADRLTATAVNWVSIAPPSEPINVCVQIRYRHTAVPARLQPLAEDRVKVEFTDPQPAVTPGQAAVFYDEDNQWILGGGWIEKAGS